MKKELIVIRGARQTGRTHVLSNEIKKELHTNPKRSVLVMSPTIKMRHVQNILKGDNYYNMHLIIIHPIDKRVTELIGGEVTVKSVADYFKDGYFDRYVDVAIFVDDPNLIADDKLSQRLKFNNNINKVAFTALTNKVKFATHVIASKEFIKDAVVKNYHTTFNQANLTYMVTEE